jgi:signal transduction histidine kinase
MINRLWRSLSFRLLLIFLLLGSAFVYGTLTAIRWVYNSEDIRGLVSGHLSLHVQYVRDDIGLPPRIDRAIAITKRVPVDIRIFGPDIDWASDPDFPVLSALEFGPSPTFSDRPGAWVDELSGVEFAALHGHNFLKMTVGDYDIVVSTPRIAERRAGPDLTWLIVGLGLALLLVGYAAVRRLFQPILGIREGAAHIGRGHFDYRIENVRSDELGDLAGDINQLAENVERMLEAKRLLLLGISHELRTPLSRLRLGVELLENETETEKNSLIAEIVEMEKIVVSLLEAERLNSSHAVLTRADVDIAALVEKLIDDFFDRERARIRVHNRLGSFVVHVDAVRIGLMLKNLLSNALRYAPEQAGPVELTLDSLAGEIALTVRDYGPGLPAEDVGRIGEPFFRGDRSRARQTGGSGLGLYLAALVARVHGGTLQLVEVQGPGACFEVRLPIADAPAS